ncbi:hypothetical protein ACE1ET_13675 [Saccharicrinis sp. FJH62]|uniref:hypothetical protein n=1 Tax=Saccharicrinis sp. FJH62 TaxID=3344657 RepID=UPI0035D40DBF
METTVSVINYVINGLVFVLIIVKIYYSYISNAKVNFLITEYYAELKLNVLNIDKLNLTEKIKYGVPINSLFRFYGFFFTIFSLKTKPVRKVELDDIKGNEFTKYIEVVIKKRKLISCNEFDSYEI